MRDGAPRIVSRASLATAWGVSVSTVSSRLLDYAAAGIILREALGGNQGTRITFLREPTSDELADRFTETAPSERSSSGGRAPAKTRSLKAPPTPAPSTPAPVEKSVAPPTDSAGKVLPFRGSAPPAMRSGALAAQLSEPDEEEDVERGAVVEASEPEPESQPDSVADPSIDAPETLPALPVVTSWSMSVPVQAGAGWPLAVAASDAAFSSETGAPPPAEDLSPPPRRIPLATEVRLPLFRPSNGLRLVSTAAIFVSIAMIAYHSAGASAASVFHWWATLAMAIILSTGKVVLGSQAEAFLSDGEKRLGFVCMAGAVFLLAADASLLYAFRGDSLSNATAIENAAIESRERVKARLEGLLAEQKHLIAQGTQPAAPATAPNPGSAIRFAQVPTGSGSCRRIPPPWLRGKPEPTAPALEVGNCVGQLAELALTAELARAKAASVQADRAAAAADRRATRLAELPGLIKAAETELETTTARATSDHGASIVARGLNWIPAGISDVVWGEEFRPVEGRGVEIFWSWVFVLGVEIFAVGGFAAAARADRHSRKRRREELGLA